MEGARCKICGVQPAIANDILCQTCADRYSKLLRTQREKTSEFNERISQVTKVDASVTSAFNPNIESGGEVTQALLQPIQDIQRSELQTQQLLTESQLLHKQRRTTTLVGCFLLGIGMTVLAVSIVFASTIAAFVGLGLTFWGALMFFIQPKNYVRSDLMNATAISSLKTIDSMMLGMGYREKGVYIRAHDSDKAVVFVPSEPFSLIPQLSGLDEDRTFLNDPAGLLVPPPGLALAALIEKKLSFKLKNCGVDTLAEALPKVLVEDLEIVKDVEIEVKDDSVRFKLIDSIYADFCSEIRETSRRCGLGCPMCSALACILAIATGKPVLYEEDKMSDDKKITESVYQLISGQRL
ncbi:MAG: hypothetical protein ABSE39_11615 [Candidatus Bathyarchaeia archaeon]